MMPILKKLNCLIEITPDNNEQSKNFSLFPFDVINIRKMAVYENRRWLPLVGRELSGKICFSQ
jgi:hypothetical protein